GGNQRENDRLRAQKKQVPKKKKSDGSNFRNALEIQAETMRQKQKIADERKASLAINNNIRNG
ncbi:hypothetical protein PORY_001309, partial [Pneumocystis oryctolagi]